MSRTRVMLRQPSRSICADECGAQCCRAPGHFALRGDELDRLRRLAADLELPLRVFRVGGDVPFVIDFANNGGACPFLDRATSLCRIHPERPDACRDFPTQPEDRCILFGSAPLGAN
jgi:Fe-S-cluster containining protein